MKPLFILLITFALAFGASALLEIPFFGENGTRTFLVWLMIACIVVLGFLVFRHTVLQVYGQSKKQQS